MIEVFRTNVVEPKHAKMLKEQIKNTFEEYEASFDLEDCDRILRVKSSNGHVKSGQLINFIGAFGFFAEVLPDNYPLPVIESLLNKSLCQQLP